MATKIEWCDETANPIVPVSHNGKPVKGGWGCTKIAAGCRNCYAERMNQNTAWGGNGEPFTGSWEFALKQKVLDDILKRQKSTRYFLQDMGDVCHPNVPFDFFHRIVMLAKDTHRHTYMLLTKRPHTLKEWCGLLPYHLPSNIWLGTSVSGPDDLKNIELLCQCPAAVRFVSYEPALEPINWYDVLGVDHAVEWVIVGGESGPKARPCNVRWIRSARKQCYASGCKVFIKQFGANVWDNGKRLQLKHPKGGDPSEWPDDLRAREVPDGE